MNNQELSKIKKAGRIMGEVVKYARQVIKPRMKLLEIAEKIEKKIIELGGKPAFPVNLCINEITAHYTPSHDDETIASGLLKVDIGVSIDGYIADAAFSIDLEKSEENKKLIEASEKALNEAIEVAKKNKTLGEIGRAIQETIIKTSRQFSPIRNLSGHEIKQYELHAGLTIPNYDNGNSEKLHDGIYAIEPFATAGQGIVYDGKPSGIFNFKGRKAVRDSNAREIMNFIENEYKTRPFCSRWLVKKFGSRALLSLHLLEQAGVLHQYSTLIEKAKMPVSQAETTIIINEGKIEVLCSIID